LRGADGAPATVDAVALAADLLVLAGGVAGTALAGPAGVLGSFGTRAALDVGLKVLEKVSDNVGWKWEIGGRGRARTSDQDARVRRVLGATNALLDQVRTELGRETVLLVDGLDRVRAEPAFVDLFVDSSLLAGLRAHVVTTLHLALVEQHRHGLRCGKAFDFENVPVADSVDPRRPGPGVVFFRDARRRGSPTWVWCHP